MKIMLATAEPHFDEAASMSSSPDDTSLASALQQEGFEVQIAPWERYQHWMALDADLVLPRSTWNYHLAYGSYIAWLSHVAQNSMLQNPLPALLWNSNKSIYLPYLEQRRIPIAPSIFLESGGSYDLSLLMHSLSTEQAMIKPTIATNGYGTFLVQQDNLEAAHQHLQRFLPHQSMMLQPYIKTVATLKERCHVFFDGAWSHAFLRNPFQEHDEEEHRGEQQLTDPEIDEICLATRVMCLVEQFFDGEHLMCGRVDIIRDERGDLRVMALELIDPVLHLEYGTALAKMVQAIKRRLQFKKSFDFVASAYRNQPSDRLLSA